MSENLNFSTQFYPKINDLKNWVNNCFYPYIKTLSQRIDTLRIYNLFEKNDCLRIKPIGKKCITSRKKVIEELNYFSKKAGLYGISLTIRDKSAFIYIGKSKDLSERCRQHLTGKNLSGRDISKSVHHKHLDILKLVRDSRYEVKFFIWSNSKLTKSLNVDYELGALEALLIASSKKDYLDLKKENDHLPCHWNLRVG